MRIFHFQPPGITSRSSGSTGPGSPRSRRPSRTRARAAPHPCRSPPARCHRRRPRRPARRRGELRSRGTTPSRRSSRSLQTVTEPLGRACYFAFCPLCPRISEDRHSVPFREFAISKSLSFDKTLGLPSTEYRPLVHRCKDGILDRVYVKAQCTRPRAVRLKASNEHNHKQAVPPTAWVTYPVLTHSGTS